MKQMGVPIQITYSGYMDGLADNIEPKDRNFDEDEVAFIAATKVPSSFLKK